MQNTEIVLSNMGHTWIIDLDGTIVKHNGYKIDGIDSLLPGCKEFLENISHSDMIVFLTSRNVEYSEITEKFLKNEGIKWDFIIYGAPYGERILINDDKPSGLQMSYSVNVSRDVGLNMNIVIDDKI